MFDEDDILSVTRVRKSRAGRSRTYLEARASVSTSLKRKILSFRVQLSKRRGKDVTEAEAIRSLIKIGLASEATVESILPAHVRGKKP